MIWYLGDLARYQHELQEVQRLVVEADWLAGLQWRIDSRARLCFDFEITVGAAIIPLTLRYGSSFPNTPPTIFPDPPQRLSEHQYQEADLCLEFGPDTWRPEVTGAELVRSAQRLLSGEAVAALDPTFLVPSRHQLTVGQSSRNDRVRFLGTVSLKQFLDEAPSGRLANATFRLQLQGFSAVFLVASIEGLNETAWLDPGLPAGIVEATSINTGVVLKLPTDVAVPAIDHREDLDAFLAAHGGTPSSVEPGTYQLVLLHTEIETRLFWIGKEGALLPATTLWATNGQRLDQHHNGLATKTVGIVGCGSVGSKIATMLARGAVRGFLLVDDDPLFPENLVRHELDWTDVGQHKADALANRLALIAPNIQCTVRKQRLGGQESNTVADSTLQLLEKCDLIVDATADATVFNLLSGAATAAAKPLVWAEVFGGGIGGLIARCRPQVDPAPQAMRACIDAWYEAQGVPAPRPTAHYGASTMGQPVPIVADDADVTVIAAHASRFALDLLMERAPSAFPVSAYVIGLSAEWLFSQPFVTFPIDCGAAPEAAPPAEIDNRPEIVAEILKLVSESRDHPATTS